MEESNQIEYLDNDLATESVDEVQPKSYIEDPDAYDDWYRNTEEVEEVTIVQKDTTNKVGGKKLPALFVVVVVVIFMVATIVTLTIWKRRR